ncbi:cobalamin biosynthesis precorrin-8W decarboxylase CbiT [Methanocaldococcus villosus KIN24-T80]|uniref:Probable cobalt-precorrin-6B C(15)-methyltransferase (decarboxylating) n=1 Tax=Methanocaldococcus villosus KIN24-T80 TaxID=1069083 RepID=N6VXL1_9EURY|nr:precorrin-6Y C5,15-methyltransferase (decarboxylating) subunit CbiT [Methanocaldococcus villosus]ENN95872.1 cobalamin biosynthesis precorrin-8W decarboxylase CbiT [Methanocaldococcus villosus KIN24-T80]
MEFITEKDIPITKEEIRAISLYKLDLKESDTVVDIGCGSGAMTVDIAKRVKKVYAIDFNEKAIELTKKNLNKFNIRNCEVILAKAEDVLDKLEYNKAFIGGTKNLEKIIKILSNKEVKLIVANTILLESTYKAINLFEQMGYSVEAVNAFISYSKKISSGHMFLARNPITIIKAYKL